MIEFSNVGLRYGQGPEILRDLNFRIEPGSFHFLTGPSGSGKTSLVFNTIAAESQRMINQTYSAFVQGFMPAIDRPEVDALDGLTPESVAAALLPPAAAVANYVPWAITGNLIMTSGNLPWRDGKLAYTGKIGRELSGEDGYKCCQLSCLNAIAQIRCALGELSLVRRIVRLGGTIWVDEGFKEHPNCLNGASDLINTAFGERGRHSRMIYTNPVMPLDCTSLVVLYAEIE